MNEVLISMTDFSRVEDRINGKGSIGRDRISVKIEGFRRGMLMKFGRVGIGF